MTLIAITLFERKAFSQCIATAEQAIQDASLVGAAVLSYPLSASLISLGRYADGEAVARRAISVLESHPDDMVIKQMNARIAQTNCYLFLAKALAHHGNYREASQVFHKAVDIIKQRAGFPGIRGELNLFSRIATTVFEDGGNFDAAVSIDSWTRESRSYSADRHRRMAMQLIKKGLLDEAEKLLMKTVQSYKVFHEMFAAFSIPDPDLTAFCRALVLLADFLDQYRHSDESMELARLVRSEVNEVEAIEDALKAALLEDTRRAAASAVMADRHRDEGGGVKVGRRKKKSGKARRKGKKKDQQGIDKADEQGSSLADVASASLSIEDAADDPSVYECPIWSLVIEDEDEEATTVCDHSFHRSCLTLWIEKCQMKDWAPTCPMCRTRIEQI